MSSNKEKVFIYWDNSNIYISAQSVAEDREGVGAKARVRVHFKSLLHLAHADREIARAVAVGSIPPELKHVWNSMENEGIEVKLQERGALNRGGASKASTVLCKQKCFGMGSTTMATQE